MITVNIYEAKTHLSDLVEKAAQGEEIVIAKAGTPRARLVPIAVEPRKPGCWKGKVWIAEDFDEPLSADVQKYFEGEDDFDWNDE